MKGKKLTLAGRVFLGILALFSSAKVLQGKGRLDILNGIESYPSQWVRIVHSIKSDASEELDQYDAIFGPNYTPYYIGSKIVSIVEEKELFKDFRPENSTRSINLELSIHQTAAPRGSPITLDSINELWCSLPLVDYDFDNKPITLWERNIIDSNNNPNEPNNYTISFIADVREVIDRNRGIVPLLPLNGIHGSEIPYMYAQTRFNTFSGDFNLDGKVDGKDFTILANDWNVTDVNSVADTSGPCGIPDKKVDFYDLGLYLRDYLKDSDDPNTYSELTPKVNGASVLDGSNLEAFQTSSRRLFCGRKEPLYAKKEKEAA